MLQSICRGFIHNRICSELEYSSSSFNLSINKMIFTAYSHIHNLCIIEETGQNGSEQPIIINHILQFLGNIQKKQFFRDTISGPINTEIHLHTINLRLFSPYLKQDCEVKHPHMQIHSLNVSESVLKNILHHSFPLMDVLTPKQLGL